jgi:hypothetical protein
MVLLSDKQKPLAREMDTYAMVVYYLSMITGGIMLMLALTDSMWHLAAAGAIIIGCGYITNLMFRGFSELVEK